MAGRFQAAAAAAEPARRGGAALSRESPRRGRPVRQEQHVGPAAGPAPPPAELPRSPRRRARRSPGEAAAAGRASARGGGGGGGKANGMVLHPEEGRLWKASSCLHAFQGSPCCRASENLDLLVLPCLERKGAQPQRASFKKASWAGVPGQTLLALRSLVFLLRV
ncbi:PH domain leucine-rich repeat protein phosphatase 1 [Hemicordylus capensis]|uniref:PH domain leucine-rich repeat protein phosphatase 1 n=1 Tax=Hemicordylus capensis TaxID=884348 RepID=UPI00230345BF|nr:PH domain leucine-rich repeat protein phosphatase 1 [Hemicordylus capensis]